jgi:hypothetical protein
LLIKKISSAGCCSGTRISTTRTYWRRQAGMRACSGILGADFKLTSRRLAPLTRCSEVIQNSLSLGNQSVHLVSSLSCSYLPMSHRYIPVAQNALVLVSTCAERRTLDRLVPGHTIRCEEPQLSEYVLVLLTRDAFCEVGTQHDTMQHMCC